MFIAIEGIRKSGKTTQLNKLVEWLKVTTKIKLYKTEEPFGTDIIKQLKSPSLPLPPARQLELIVADRKDHIKYVLIPQRECFFWVFCENFTLATIANLGYGQGLNIDDIRDLNAKATGSLVPNLTIVLDCFIDEAIARNHKIISHHDYQPLDIVGLDKTRLGYLEEAGKQGCSIIDGNRGVDTVFEEIKQLVLPYLPEEEKENIKAKLF